MNFNSWIKQFLDEDSQFGDLARDIERDKSFPSNVTDWSQIENHIHDDIVIEIAKSAFEDYKASL